MAYDERLAMRVRESLDQHEVDVLERRMFGGLCFMVRGHMCVGIVGDDLMLRVGADNYEALLGVKHARPMDFTGRPMTGMLYVAAAGLKTRVALDGWIEKARSFVAALPKKVGQKARVRAVSFRARTARKKAPARPGR